MPKINYEEYEKLKGLVGRRMWIARDSDGDLFFCLEKPIKNHDSGGWNCGGWFHSIYNHLFQFIKWEDEEPYNIAELIREYESVEAEMKKDKKWLVDKWTKERNETNVYDPMYQFASEFIADVNQLDEPEVLSQESLEVPQFVFDWIKECKKVNVLDEIFYLESALSSQNMRKEHEMYFWLKNNFDTFAKAWLAYPNIEVEGEQKYYVLDTEGETMIRKNDSGVRTSSGFKIKNGFEGENYTFTEQEIKDFDPRYWPFRKPVEEVEE